MSLDLACDPKEGNLRGCAFLRNLCGCAFAVTNRGSGKQRRPLGDFQVSAALVPPQPAESDGALDTGAELLATAGSRQKWLIDAFDENTAILHRFDAVRGLDDPARGGIGIGEGLPLDEFQAAIVISSVPRAEAGRP